MQWTPYKQLLQRFDPLPAFCCAFEMNYTVITGETELPMIGIVMAGPSVNEITSSELNYSKIKEFVMFLGPPEEPHSLIPPLYFHSVLLFTLITLLHIDPFRHVFNHKGEKDNN